MRSVCIILLAMACSAEPAYAGDKARFAVAASDSLTTSPSCELLGKIPGTDPASRALTDGAYMLKLRGDLTNIVTAVSITWWLSKASDGEKAESNVFTEAIDDPDSDGNGAVNTVVNTGFTVDADTTAHNIYVCAETDAGTATMITRLTWEQR